MTLVDFPRDDLVHLDGLFVGMLDASELELFENAVAVGMAHRSFEGAGGFMGLAKVRVLPPVGDFSVNTTGAAV